MNFLEQLTYNVDPGEQHEARSLFALPNPEVRIITFYLPQFHPIPENDRWWGKGFTEWTNVTKAVPRFEGHYQPHLPGELGFYDLRNPDSLRAQAELARSFGIYGFCFHYYWFGGRKLLDTPLNILLSNPDIDIRFCINWANESWSRRWDGSEHDILIGQQHSKEDDLAFATALELIVRDPRYIRIGERPLIVLYRPGVLPDARETIGRWRDQFKSLGLADPYVVMAQAHGTEDPRPFGMDAAVEFPPHKWWDLPDINRLAPAYTAGYRGKVLSYDMMAQSSSTQQSPTEYTLFPGVCPSWDNEARKPNRGICFLGSTPEKYAYWLDSACHKALQREDKDERLVFVNAWNEWAEGAHLEPDRHFGYAYLNATGRVVTGLAFGMSDKMREKFRSMRPSRDAWLKKRMRNIARKGASVLDRFGAILRSL
jgi:lipopolysaccharide biosynthesis protein